MQRDKGPAYAVQAQPRSRYVYLAWAMFEKLQGEVQNARRLLQRGRELNPKDSAILQVTPPCIESTPTPVCVELETAELTPETLFVKLQAIGLAKHCHSRCKGDETIHSVDFAGLGHLGGRRW